MRTILLLLLLFTASTKAISQDTLQLPATSAPGEADVSIAKGNWLVGAIIGSTGYNFSTDTYSLLVNPRAGYFIGQNFVLGAEFLANLESLDEETNFRYGITPFVRYYYTQGGGPSGRIFQEGVVGIAGSSVEGADDEPVSFVIGIRFGYAHFIARNVSIEPILGYTYTKADIGDSSGGGGLALALGLQIYLPGRGTSGE
ncbi:hypothetical protein [Pontibacter ruber]|uniref:Outer membrane protein beta-barrel domain-containing protein n=1 Tax=Pontibacter ruber TaxID=1343895 RepID=A0ABW5CT20_9BACT|nr:hypothetical protein [Pontibacter ruber]